MTTNKRNLGFANMDKNQQREIASQGGRVAHEKGVAHEFTPEEAREAGRKGGRAVSRNREHMAQIGRLGARAKAERTRMRAQNPQPTASGEAEIFRILRTDHETVNQIFSRLLTPGTEQERARDRIYPELRAELQRHTSLEEKVVYPALETKPALAPLAQQARQEHTGVKTMIDRIDSLSAGDASFEALVSQLRDDVKRHVAEEESNIFAKMRECFTDAELTDLSRRVREEKSSGVTGSEGGVSAPQPSMEARNAETQSAA